MQLGYIMARVYTSEAEIPIEGAVFTVESPMPGDKYLYGVRTTDETGKTSLIPIEAPDAALSKTPGNALPYATVNVRISHPEYATKYITGVQIFAGQVSVQQAPMLPIDSEVSPEEKTEIYDIPESNL